MCIRDSYHKILDELGKKSGMLGAIFKKARQDIQNPATLRRLIVELIDTENWSSMQANKRGRSGRSSLFPSQLIVPLLSCVRCVPFLFPFLQLTQAAKP